MHCLWNTLKRVMEISESTVTNEERPSSSSPYARRQYAFDWRWICAANEEKNTYNCLDSEMMCRKTRNGGIQGQAGCGSGQPGLVVGYPAHRRGVETKWSLWFFSTQAILWFYEKHYHALPSTKRQIFPNIFNDLLCSPMNIKHLQSLRGEILCSVIMLPDWSPPALCAT